jgi:nucleoside-diphosphate-sugar epimerase
LRPIAYNRSIVDAEASAARFTKAGGAGIVLRFAAFYGPDSRFLIEGIAQMRKTGRVFLPGPPEAFASSISHDDAATAAVSALTLPAGTYNVADDEPVMRREYFDSLARAMGLPPPKPFPWWARAMMGSLGAFLSRSERISNRKLKASSLWVPRYRSVREGWPSVAAAMPAAA